jgi:hypothetical protein
MFLPLHGIERADDVSRPDARDPQDGSRLHGVGALQNVLDEAPTHRPGQGRRQRAICASTLDATKEPIIRWASRRFPRGQSSIQSRSRCRLSCISSGRVRHRTDKRHDGADTASVASNRGSRIDGDHLIAPSANANASRVKVTPTQTFGGSIHGPSSCIHTRVLPSAKT